MLNTRRANRLLFAMTCAALLQVGCETKTQTGALTGAALGTATGALVGGNVTGAAIGAGVGTVAGGLVGLGMDQSDRAKEQRAAQQAAPTAVTPRERLSYDTIANWVLEYQVDRLGSLTPYVVDRKTLHRLHQAYEQRRFFDTSEKLTAIQQAYLYGVICYFEAGQPEEQRHPLCDEPPAIEIEEYPTEEQELEVVRPVE